MKYYRCIHSKEDSDFVACMEDLLDVYEPPYSQCSLLCIYMKDHKTLW